MAVPEPLEPLDRRLIAWMARYGATLTRLALGIVFTWFGLLKFFPGTSPAETLATDTILRVTLLLLFFQMAGAMLPLLLFPGETFVKFPLVPTLEGQYIIKNLVLISAAIVVGATVRKKDAEARKREGAK